MRFILGFLIMVSTIFGFDTSIFPKTENDEKQIVLTLKPLENEDEYLHASNGTIICFYSSS